MPLTLYRRGDIWHLRGTVAGQRIRESTRISSKRAAEVYRARREAELIERRAFGRAATRTFAEAAVIYMEAGGETRFLSPLILHFGPDTLVSDIDAEAVNKVARMAYPNAAPSTINRQVITPISAVVAMHYKAIGQRPPLFSRRPEGNARIRWLTPVEADALLIACDDRIRPIVGFLLGTGCRTSEAFKLEAKDMYLGTGEAFISDPKNGHARMVQMPTRSLAMMPTELDEGAVFLTPKGEPYHTGGKRGGQMQTAFNRARDKAGLGEDVTPHIMRHTWATWYHAQTKDFGGLMDLGGWRSANMANRYRKIAPADLGERLLAHGWDFTDTKPAHTLAEKLRKEQIRLIK